MKAFAAMWEEQLPRLDVAIMNAGFVASKYEVSSDGWETALQVNVLSIAPLSCLLLPQMVKSAKTYRDSVHHLAVLSSDAHLQAKFPERNDPKLLESLSTTARFNGNPFNRYAVSKLFDVYIAIELAHLTPEIHSKPTVIVNYAIPGFCKSELLSITPSLSSGSCSMAACENIHIWGIMLCRRRK